jgi:CPA1 family monovalent cation:H+ antiporter
MERRPPLKVIFLAGWAGMRGMVSLASALAIPLTLPSDEPFAPHLVLFITFVVILITLVFQGLSMPLLIRWLKVEELETHSRRATACGNPPAHGRLLLNHLSSRYVSDVATNATLSRFYEDLQLLVGNAQLSLSDGAHAKEQAKMDTNFKIIFLELITQRRHELERVRREKVDDSEVLLEYEHELELEEAQMRSELAKGSL